MQSKRETEGWILEVTINPHSSTRRKAGAKYLVLDSYSITHVRSSIPDSEYRYPTLESTLRVELASNMTEDVW